MSKIWCKDWRLNVLWIMNLILIIYLVIKKDEVGLFYHAPIAMFIAWGHLESLKRGL